MRQASYKLGHPSQAKGSSKLIRVRLATDDLDPCLKPRICRIIDHLGDTPPCSAQPRAFTSFSMALTCASTVNLSRASFLPASPFAFFQSSFRARVMVSFKVLP